jgi:hypothetical protein
MIATFGSGSSAVLPRSRNVSKRSPIAGAASVFGFSRFVIAGSQPNDEQG